MPKLPMKVKNSPRKPKHSLALKLKALKTAMRKRPIMSTVGVAAIVMLLSVGIYKLPGLAHNQNANVDTAKPRVTKSVKNEATKVDEKPADSIQESAQPAAKEEASPKPKPAAPVDPNAPAKNVGGVMSKPGCYVGCTTPNPTFSIITNNSITVTVGTSAGPFTASTSNGSSVSWSTPTYTGAYNGVHGYANTLSHSAVTLEYFIRAEPNTPPGTYVLKLDALHPPTEQKVVTSISVNVVAPTPGSMY